MTLGQVVLVLYGLLMIVGGAMGYRAGSAASLYAGGGSGVVLLAAFVVSRFQLSVGIWIGIVVGALLAVSFVMRLAKTGKFMPSGGLLILSVVAVGLMLWSQLRG